MNDMSIGSRMKEFYEFPWQLRLPMRMPTIIRLDGKTFHTFTRGMKKPFDIDFVHTMSGLARDLCESIQTSQMAYVQSDEISILLHPYKRLVTQGWMGNELQKMVSISAAMASARLSRDSQRLAYFDSRVFVLPEEEVVNYFLWRQQDWEKNSVQMLARSYFSHKDLHGKHRKEMVDMIFQAGGNWNTMSTYLKRGTCIVKTDGKFEIDENPPIFSQDRDYIHKFLNVEEE